MLKKLVFVALVAASFTACDFFNKKTQASADSTTATESLPPSITDTVGSLTQNEATSAVSDKEIAAEKRKAADEAAATSKKGTTKKAADEAAAKKKAADAEAAAKKKAADAAAAKKRAADAAAVKKAEKAVKNPPATSTTTTKPGSVTKNPGAMIPSAPDNIKKRSGKDDVLVRSEVAPSYPGGEAAMMKYLQKNLKYPMVAKENGVKGTVYVQFVVEKDGKVDDIVIARSVDKSLDAEAKRVVAAMPKWAAGKQAGQAVAVQYVLPVKFDLVE